MAEIKNVNTQEMLNVADKLKAKIEEWRQQVTDIYAKQQELDGMWDGHANDEFNRQWEEDRPKYDKLAQVMEDYATAITNAANKYDQTEEQITSSIK